MNRSTRSAAYIRMACAAVLWCAVANAPAQELLTLDAAMARVLAVHPELDDRAERAQRQAQLDAAAQRPALRAGAQLENLLGSGSVSGVRATELTLTLESVLEARAKRSARVAVAAARLHALDGETAVRRHDLLAEVARRYLDAAGSAALADILALDLAQRERTVAAARRRVAAGAAPRSQELAAHAAWLKARLEVRRLEQAGALARQRLALLWQPEGSTDTAPDFSVQQPPAMLPALEPLPALRRRLAEHPELIRLADEQRIREAQLTLARSQSHADPAWQLGVRRLQAASDHALVAGFSIPLGSAGRAAPAIREAHAELDALAPEKRTRELALAGTLAEAHGQYVLRALTAQQLDSELLPALVAAEAAAADAYAQGALSYLEWAQLQSETTAARREQLQARLDAQRTLIEIQRLTGLPGLEER